MRGATPRTLSTAPRRWCIGAALAAVAVVVAAAAASGALADTGPPGGTTPTPTVTAPDAAPPPPAPKPDPGPVYLVPKPQPHVVHRTTRVAPVVVQPVYRAPVTPAVVVQPSRPAAKPKKATPQATPRRVTKPRPQGPAIPLQHGSARRSSSSSSSGGGWVLTAIVAGLALLLLSAVFVATRRALRTTPGVEIASDVGLTSPNGSRPAPHDEELLPLETLLHLPTPSHPPILAAEKRCAIGWWRGYVRSQFLASETGEAGSTVIAESPPFAWRSSKPPPQTDEAVAAHRQLIATISNLGWQAVEFGPAWFEVEFHRASVASVST